MLWGRRHTLQAAGVRTIQDSRASPHTRTQRYGHKGVSMTTRTHYRLIRFLAINLLSTILVGCYGSQPARVTLPIPPGLQEVPQGFDLSTNGFESQADMDNDRAQFEQDAEPGVLGPFFNNRSCLDCHSNPVTGGNSALFEHRIGPDDPNDQVAAASLIHDQSVSPDKQQRSPDDATNALRMTLNLFGDGLVEQVLDGEFKSLAAQNGGQIIAVPILERPGQQGIGRFGWKDQHASLLSFAGDAACNEIGEENRLVNGFGCN